MTRPASHNWLVVMAPKCFACPEQDCLQWTDRLDTLCLGRCSCTNQVSSVYLSVLCRWRMDISPVTQKNKGKKRAALLVALQAGPWHVVALKETQHASQAEITESCREGADPTAPWDGPSFWASGTSRGGLAFQGLSRLVRHKSGCC